MHRGRQWAADALEALSTRRFDVLLLGHPDARLDGYQTARQIVSDASGSTHRPWIVAMTANAMEGRPGGLLAAGMNDYLRETDRRPAPRSDPDLRCGANRRPTKADKARPTPFKGPSKDWDPVSGGIYFACADYTLALSVPDRKHITKFASAPRSSIPVSRELFQIPFERRHSFLGHLLELQSESKKPVLESRSQGPGGVCCWNRCCGGLPPWFQNRLDGRAGSSWVLCLR